LENSSTFHLTRNFLQLFTAAKLRYDLYLNQLVANMENRIHLLASGLLLALISALAIADTTKNIVAEIISIQGLGSYRRGADQDWSPAKASQGVLEGSFVRTNDASKMALLFTDDTQVRLNQNSIMQVRNVAKKAGDVTTVLLAVGRAWSQTKRQPGSELNFETPAASAAIRGTDWEIEVDSEGKTLMTVFSGKVEFFNASGRITVERNEAAVAEVGKAPVKLLLSSPRDRVQWVNSIRPEAFRYLQANDTDESQTLVAQLLQTGDLASARQQLINLVDSGRGTQGSYLLLADIQLSDGEFLVAEHTLESGLARFKGDARLLSQLARIQILAERLDAADQTLAKAHADSAEPSVFLIQGLLAQRRGDGDGAIRAYEKAIVRAPGEDRAWFGLGSIQTEREDSLPARRNLSRALEIHPKGAGYLGEIGVLETFANRFSDAALAFQTAIEQNPGDYVALTGRGLLYLKQGKPDAALEDFLRAGVMEPRYARAKTYTAITYYQQGRHADAISTLHQAIEIDEKDPLPFMLLAQIYTDLFEAGKAVHASRAAIDRLPYLKSVNQLANDQKGNANLGASLAFFGMEDWAMEQAVRSYSPFWGGSHLFLADRYSGEFNKNSELFQGFLTDPLAFGADPKFSSLLRRPGTYGTLEWMRDMAGYRLGTPSVTVNGMTASETPVSYFLKADRPGGRYPAETTYTMVDGHLSPPINTFLKSEIYTLGIGSMLNERLGVFLYANKFWTDFRRSEQFDGRLASASNDMNSIGLSYRWSPRAQSWLKLGSYKSNNNLDGFPSTYAEGPLFSDLALASRQRKSIGDVQFRHTVDLATTRLSLGYEQMNESQHANTAGIGLIYLRSAPHLGALDLLAFSGENNISRRFSALTLAIQTDLSSSIKVDSALAANQISESIVGRSLSYQVINNISTSTAVRSHPERTVFAPRLGAIFTPREGLSVRAAYQHWVRPLAVSTLNSVETAGLPIEDRLVQAGGESKRLVFQIGGNPDPRTYLTMRIESQKINNPANAGVDLRTPSLPFLEDLRASQLTNLSSMDIIEPGSDFQSGRLNSVSLAINRMLTSSVSGYAKLTNTHSSSKFEDSANGSGTITGKQIPLLPARSSVLGCTWITPMRTYISARAVYRSQRFEDQENTISLPGGWRFDAVGLWETRDKTFLIGAGILNIGNNRSSTREPTRYAIDVRYRF